MPVADAVFTVEPEWMTTRYFMDTGALVDVTHARPDGSWIRERVLAECAERFGKREWKIVGSVVISPAPAPPEKPTRGRRGKRTDDADVEQPGDGGDDS